VPLRVTKALLFFERAPRRLADQATDELERDAREHRMKASAGAGPADSTMGGKLIVTSQFAI
jgi:hypothetical protein